MEGAKGLIGARVESRGSNIITAPRGREEQVGGGGGGETVLAEARLRVGPSFPLEFVEPRKRHRQRRRPLPGFCQTFSDPLILFETVQSKTTMMSLK